MQGVGAWERSRCPCFWDTGNTFAHYSFPVSMFLGHWEHFISDGVQGGAKSGICLALEDFHFGKLEEEGFAAELLKLHNGLEV